MHCALLLALLSATPTPTRVTLEVGEVRRIVVPGMQRLEVLLEPR